MDQQDRDNLNFIMKSSSKDFDRWLETASDDDIEYALEIIAKRKSEVSKALNEFDFNAGTYLKKFQLNGGINT